jgi:hypothetical protein
LAGISLLRAQEVSMVCGMRLLNLPLAFVDFKASVHQYQHRTPTKSATYLEFASSLPFLTLTSTAVIWLSAAYKRSIAYNLISRNLWF